MPREPPSLKPALRALALFPRFTRWAAASVQARHLSHGLSLRQLGALAAIHGGATSPGEIARRLHVTPAVVTGLVDRLERRGYVRRQAASDDRRRQRLALTAAGRAVRLEVQQALARELGEQLEDVSAADLAAIDRALERLERALDALEKRAAAAEEGEDLTEEAMEPPRARRRAETSARSRRTHTNTGGDHGDEHSRREQRSGTGARGAPRGRMSHASAAGGAVRGRGDARSRGSRVPRRVP